MFEDDGQSNAGDMYVPYVLSEETLAEAGLPVVSVWTQDNKRILSKNSWIPARMTVTNVSDEAWNFSSDTISIRGRGNSTWAKPKRPYALRLAEEQELLGMPRHRRWVLMALYCDVSFLKNACAFYLSRQLGMKYTVRGEFVNLVLNGNYVGLYWLGESISIGRERVNINESSDYLLELDRRYDDSWNFTTEIKRLPFSVKNDDSMTEKKRSAIKSSLDGFESILYEASGAVKGSTDIWQQRADYDSFAAWWLVNSIMANADCFGLLSVYAVWKTGSRRLSLYPVWDFDTAAHETFATLYDTGYGSASIYFDALFTDAAFVRCITTELKQLDSADFEAFFDGERTKISASVALDGQRWGKHGDFWDNSLEWDSVEVAQAYLRNFISVRIGAYKSRYSF